MKRADIEFLKEARQFLENPSLITRVSDAIGKPVEMLQKNLPENMSILISTATQKSLQKGLEWSLLTLPDQTEISDRREIEQDSKFHVAATSFTGALGGFFGAPALAIELPISTMITLRSIANVANKSGEDLTHLENRLECLNILAYGSKKSDADDAVDSAYFAQRIAFAQLLKNASTFLANKQAGEILSAVKNRAAPEVLTFIARVAAGFEIVVTEKFLAGALPIVGAAGGALINGLFTDHFNKTAYYHFGMRRLERAHGTEAVQAAYLDQNAEPTKRVRKTKEAPVDTAQAQV